LKNSAKYFTIIFLFVAIGCTTKKNTVVTRNFHNITSYYNVYFNGYESFKIGNKAIKDKYVYNFNEILPVFLYSNAEQTKVGSSDMDLAIQKGAKAITNHSITVKPKLKNKSKLTDKDKEFYSKPEFCKWIDDSYLLMGKANFYTQEYQKAIRSFRLIMSQYKKENTKYEAMLWLAKTYIEQSKYSEAKDVLDELINDARHPQKLDKEIKLTRTDLNLRQENYDKAITLLLEDIKATRNKTTKARYKYILAQIYERKGDLINASEYYKQVIKLNPPYEMAFNAKIKRATAFNLESGNANEIKKQLRKMLRDEKNIEYQDQIYYALANMEIKENNEPQGIEYFKLSIQKSVSNKTQKAMSYLSLADIYFSKPEYLLAGAYYDSTMQNLPEDYDNYETISKKATNLVELVTYLTEIQNQDSLQMVAKMSEAERSQFINNIIEKVVAQEAVAANATLGSTFESNSEAVATTGKWYFYNPTAVSQGVTEFKKKWGTRTLEDDWRRSNKSAVSNFDNEDNADNEDSTKVTNNKMPEFYLQNLPLTDSLIKISDDKIISALYTAGDIYYNKIKDYDEAIKTFEDLNKRYPKNIYTLESYYALYNLYNLINRDSKAEYYKNQITSLYPESQYSRMLLDPDYINQLTSIEEQSNNLYLTTLDLYKARNYNNVIANTEFAYKMFSGSQAIPKFLYLKSLAYGQIGNTDSLIINLKKFIEIYPTDDAVELAKEIIASVESGKFDMNIYNVEFSSPHYYVVAIKKDKYDLKALNFKLTVASNNFSDAIKFSVDEINLDDYYSLLTIKTFDNKDNALLFYNQIITNFTLSELKPDDYEHFIISESNYNIFVKDKILEKYLMYFKDKYL